MCCDSPCVFWYARVITDSYKYQELCSCGFVLSRPLVNTLDAPFMLAAVLFLFFLFLLSLLLLFILMAAHLAADLS